MGGLYHDLHMSNDQQYKLGGDLSHSKKIKSYKLSSKNSFSKPPFSLSHHSHRAMDKHIKENQFNPHQAAFTEPGATEIGNIQTDMRGIKLDEVNSADSLKRSYKSGQNTFSKSANDPYSEALTPNSQSTKQYTQDSDDISKKLPHIFLLDEKEYYARSGVTRPMTVSRE